MQINFMEVWLVVLNVNLYSDILMFSPTFSVTYGSCIKTEWLHDLYIITCYTFACSILSYKEKLIFKMPSSLIMQLHMKMKFLPIEDGL